MPSATKNEKILVVSGNKPFGEQLAEALRAAGYLTFYVATGAEGLTTAAAVGPAVVLLDMSLPDMEVYDFLDRKATNLNDAVKSVPVFLISSQGAAMNMHRIPDGAVSEFVASVEATPADLVGRIDLRFKHAPGMEGKAASSGAVGGATAAIKDPKAPTIVWAEDDKLISSILAKKLIAAGFNIIHAKNGLEAIEALKTVVPNAMVLDLLMPDMNGFDVLQNARMDARLKDVPAMILSNLSKPSDIEKAKMLGAKKFIVKAAVSLDQIVAEIKEICK